MDKCTFIIFSPLCSHPLPAPTNPHLLSQQVPLPFSCLKIKKKNLCDLLNLIRVTGMSMEGEFLQQRQLTCAYTTEECVCPSPSGH